MKIISNSQFYTNVFFDRIIKPFRVINYDILKLLQGWTIYLGTNPTQDYFIPHCDFTKKWVVLPFYNHQGVKTENALDIDCRLGVHELGHVIHYYLYGKDEGKWAEHSRKTGEELNLVWDEIKQVRSYEQFANSIEKLYRFQLPEPYFDILGVKPNFDYTILNALEILIQEGMVTLEFYQEKRNIILKKY